MKKIVFPVSISKWNKGYRVACQIWEEFDAVILNKEIEDLRNDIELELVEQLNEKLFEEKELILKKLKIRELDFRGRNIILIPIMISTKIKWVENEM